MHCQQVFLSIHLSVCMSVKGLGILHNLRTIYAIGLWNFML